jgi:hypothetical protein
MEAVIEAKPMNTVIGITDGEKYKMVEFLTNFLPDVKMRIPTEIDSGGCGIYTKHLYLNLIKLGFDVKIGFIGDVDCKKDLKYLTSNNKLNGNRCGISHAVIQFSDYLFFDSDGLTRNPTDIARISDNEKYYGTMSIESLSILNNNIDSWNDLFDRDCEKDIIRELGKLGEKFEAFKLGDFKFKTPKTIRLSDYTIKIKKKRSRFDLFSSLGGSNDQIGDKAKLLSLLSKRLKEKAEISKKTTAKITTEKSKK